MTNAVNKAKLSEAFWFQEGPGVRNTQFRDSGVKLLNVGNITKSGQIDLEKTDRHLENAEAYGKYSHFLADAGDLVIASSGISIDNDGFLRTRGAFVEECHLPLCMNTSTIRFKAIEGKSDLAYLKHWLQSLDFRVQITRLVTGSAQKNFGPTHLKSLSINLPSLDEQKRIAAILDQADELRRKRQRAIDRLNQLSQAIFHEMFGDFITNPMGWSTVKLGDACGVGSSKRVFVEEFVDEGVPFYRGTEVGKLATGELIEPDLFIAPHHYADLVAHSGKPAIGDLLLPSICHDGRIWRVDNEKPFYFKDGRVLWIKKNEAIFDSEYLRNHLRNAFLTNYHTIASGTTFAELKIVNLKGLSVLCPPLKLQIEFSKRISEVETASLEMTKSASVANGLFASLQNRAFQGEL